MALATETIRNALADGLLSFPVTDLDANGQFVAANYADRLEWIVGHDISAVFVAGGTGEFFSLSAAEYQRIVLAATETIGDQVPLIAGAGRSIPEAIAFAGMAEKAGVHALLLMPPYLTNSPQEGLLAYARTILQHTDLPVIYYNRANGVLSAEYMERLAADCPNLIGVKDGTSDMQQLNILIDRLGDRLTYIGGAPTAEIIAEAYLSIGVNTYSSAVFNFVPELALHFYRSLRAGKGNIVRQLLRDFYIPFVELRSRRPGYAVSLIKAGATLIGRSAGSVRAPLIMPTPEEVAELEQLIARANRLVGVS